MFHPLLELQVEDKMAKMGVLLMEDSNMSVLMVSEHSLSFARI